MENKLKFNISFLCLFFFLQSLSAQQTFPKNGIYDERDGHFALTNVTLYQTYNRKIDNATLIIKDGKVVSSGANLAIPKDAITIDGAGKTVYPSFIDLSADYGLPEAKSEGQRPSQRPQMLSNKAGAYSWNEALKTEYSAAEHFNHNEKEAAAWRKIGFGTLLAHQKDGISRGTSALVSLSDERAHEIILKEDAAHHLSFSKGKSTQDYPNSRMGAIALLRQTYLDGQWYKNQDKELNLSLQAWNEVQILPQFFEVNDKLDVLRAANLGKEFGKSYIIKTGGDEYQRLDKLKNSATAYIVPLVFPDAFDVEDPYEARLVSLEQLKHWELAPSNAGKLAKAGLTIALTTDGLKKKDDFLKVVRKAIENGLTEETALKALTYTPASLLNMQGEVGSLENGRWANFILTSGNIFEEEAVIYENWVQGKAYLINESEVGKELTGDYDLKVGNESFDLKVNMKKGKPEMVVMADTVEMKVSSNYKNKLLTLAFNPAKGVDKIRLSGVVEGEKWSGRGQNAAGDWVSWSATRTKSTDKEIVKTKEKDEVAAMDKMGDISYPFMAYGWATPPKQEVYLIKNATVWTNEAEGIVTETDVLVRNGKIAQIGRNISQSGAVVIDGSGKHLTSGVIDEHSHIAIFGGVNESTQASTAEVRVGDVINSEDINIYRQLAGGVTISQLLHGSANPIGGQSAIIKLRWGYSPEEMKYEKAKPFIKFALGENVKQSNRSNAYRIRFPQTRMGVEQLFEDYFTRARTYMNQNASGQNTRRDLDLEAIAEILKGERFISCHSYQQGEINMLMKVAERHDFTVNTFTHILEGYKVADKMAKHGAGGSTFSDWWAYKYEVIDAIPQNATLMHNEGVVVAINSDDAEMARRLNQEAGKMVMYTDLSEEDAWKMVTLNPAKLLRIDQHVGSVKTGKDADLVLWSDNPLSVYAIAEYTFVDGRKFFDRQLDQQLRDDLSKERNRIIQKMLDAKKSGAKTQKPQKKEQHLYHCDD